jgi:hypothetical protein
MRSNFLKFLAVLLGICLTIPLLMAASSAKQIDNMSTIENPISDEQIIQFSNDSNDQFDKLMSHWGDKNPSYYAGAYISELSFYILVTCDPTSVQDEIWEVTGNKNINIIQVKYSYDYLEAIKNEIVSKITKLSQEGNTTAKQIIGFGVDEMSNKIFVEYLIYKKASISQSDIYDLTGYKELVDIVAKEEAYTSCTDINAGSKDWVQNPGGALSTISCCGSSVNNQGVTELGFFIAGHGGNLYEQMKIGSTTVGTVSSRSYGGQMDVSFVNLDVQSSYVRSDKLSTSYTIDGYSSVGVVGTSYTMHGMTSGIIAGTVNNRSFSFVMGGVNFSNFIRMNMTVSAGDSGGPLVKQNTGYSRNIVGTLSGGDSTYANFTKFTVMKSAFNFSLY